MTENEIHLRLLTRSEADIHQLLAIENADFNRFDAYDHHDFDHWLQYNPDLCLAAEIDGQIAGYVISRVLPDRAELASLAVHPAHMHGGVGRALLAATVAGVKRYGVKTIYIEVRRTNEAGLAFWQRMGFVRYGLQPDFYLDGETAILMRMTLL